MKKYSVEREIPNVVLKSHIVFLRWFDIVFFIVILFPLVQSLLLLDIQRFFGHAFTVFCFLGITTIEKLSNGIPIFMIRLLTYFQLFIYDYTGLFLGFNKYNFFDDLINITGGLWIGVIFFSYIFGIEARWSDSKNKSFKWKVNIYTISLLNMIKVFWEISAFVIGIILNGTETYINMREGTLFDTMTDLIYFNIGQIIGIICFWIFIKNISGLTELLKINGRQFSKFVNGR